MAGRIKYSNPETERKHQERSKHYKEITKGRDLDTDFLNSPQGKMFRSRYPTIRGTYRARMR